MKTICPDTHERPFDRQRFLDLDDQIGMAPDIGRAGDDLRTVLAILLVADAASLSCSRLNQHFVPCPRQLFNADGNRARRAIRVF